MYTFQFPLMIYNSPPIPCLLKCGVLVWGFELPHRGLWHTRGEMCHRQQQAASAVGARSGEAAKHLQQGHAFFVLFYYWWPAEGAAAAQTKQLWLCLSPLQLNMAKNTESILEGFIEGPLHFPPTYKFDVGTHTYDTRFVAMLTLTLSSHTQPST